MIDEGHGLMGRLSKVNGSERIYLLSSQYLSTAIPFYISAYQALFQRILRAATFTSAVSSGLASQNYVTR